MPDKELTPAQVGELIGKGLSIFQPIMIIIRSKFDGPETVVLGKMIDSLMAACLSDVLIHGPKAVCLSGAEGEKHPDPLLPILGRLLKNLGEIPARHGGFGK